MKQLLSLLFICLSFQVPSQAIAKDSKNHLKLVTAYTRKIPADKQTNPPMAGYFFVVKWGENTYPETFFWRGDGGWLTCKIEKAIKAGGAYKGGDIALDKIKKGDLLMLTPLTGGRFPIPDEIPESAKNTLYYRTGGSPWIGFPVKKISKK